MNNPLTEIAPGKWRRIAYFILAAIGITLAGLFAGYTAVEVDIPNWLKFSAAFYGVVTGPLWTVPGSNVSRSEL